jgi:hypothetical protein
MHVSGLGGDPITHVSSSSTGHTAAGGSVPAGGGHLAPPVRALRGADRVIRDTDRALRTTDRGSQRVAQLRVRWSADQRRRESSPQRRRPKPPSDLWRGPHLYEACSNGVLTRQPCARHEQTDPLPFFLDGG